MTTEAPERTWTLLDVIEHDLADVREELVPLVMRADALSDLRYHATRFRERTGNEPTYADLLDAAADEQERATLAGLGRRLIQEQETEQ